ncbi:hypothetical protein J4N45_19040 [Vibrio sp. SCSIO 43140]|uniref:hypothetical protein n=1 Tax=Vibrio sp. SCSIO 43140 TaxID=2819100 RepID=UPI00207514C7|nr:hypothetical protein [Vibrio sp. SCSIO 43140]USD63098.1 hypothetical protein J4N45_19040 [Vibrio sp. SCSIO 43140]
MKKLLVLVAVLAAPSFAYEHLHSSAADQWSEDSLKRWQPREAFVPLTINHIGEATRYYLEVNNEPVTELFTLEGNEKVSVDVPVTLENRQGAQLFKVCSVSLTEAAGSRICSKVELFNLYPSEQ